LLVLVNFVPIIPDNLFMHFNRKHFSNETLVDIYKDLLLPRLIEEKMLLLLQQGKISKWYSGIGQEAIAVGVTKALQSDEWILPLHRNLGVFTGRKIPLNKLFKQWQGSKDGFTKGRDRTFHFGTKEHHICGMISHLASQLPLADGIALAQKLKKENKVTVVFIGDGGTSEGDFHEAMNIAAVWDLPVIFIVENNGYALSTPNNEQFRCFSLSEKAHGYGMKGIRIEGNNVLQVFDTVSGIRDYCIHNQKPYLIECMTFRMRGHEEADEAKYVPQNLLDLWQKKDPISNYEKYLLDQHILSEQSVTDIRNELQEYINDEVEIAYYVEPTEPDSEEEIDDVYARVKPSKNAHPTINNSLLTFDLSPFTSENTGFIDSIKDALFQSMEKHPKLILMGQDIAEYGGIFKITEGFVEAFGKERVRNTPLCESGIIGASLGLSIEGYKSIIEMQFADFVTMGFNQIVNNLAKSHYRWGQNADVVIRMPTGGGVGAGPFHSQSNEAWFAHTPGLKVVYPSSPMDAKGLLIAAINDPNPVLFFEHKALYSNISEEVPGMYYEIEIGRARHIRTGVDVSIITYGMGVHWAMEYADQNDELSIDILDLRTLLPLDYHAIRAAVSRTGKILILHEDVLTGGIGAEVAAWIGEHCFDLLDAPVLRCASLDTPVPFNMELEKNFMADSRLDECVRQLMGY
jgi:2-oxoisovalerate dehydrogenase E1 component